MLAGTAGEVLLCGLRSLRTSRTAWASSAALPGEEKFVQSIRQLVAAMERLTQSPFIGESAAAECAPASHVLCDTQRVRAKNFAKRAAACRRLDQCSARCGGAVCRTIGCYRTPTLSSPHQPSGLSCCTRTSCSSLFIGSRRRYRRSYDSIDRSAPAYLFMYL